VGSGRGARAAARRSDDGSAPPSPGPLPRSALRPRALDRAAGAEAHGGGAQAAIPSPREAVSALPSVPSDAAALPGSRGSLASSLDALDGDARRRRGFSGRPLAKARAPARAARARAAWRSAPARVQCARARAARRCTAGRRAGRACVQSAALPLLALRRAVAAAARRWWPPS